MAPNVGACPSEGELSRLLLGEAPWQDVALPGHLMAGCTACWTWLGEKAAGVSTLPFDEPLAMAVRTAVTAQRGPNAGRLRWMRPQHAADARQAPRHPLAFCRLVLHETLPTSFHLWQSRQVPGSLGELAQAGDRLAESTTTYLLQAAHPLTTPAHRHDIEAISLTYRAFLQGWATVFDAAEALLEAAHSQLERGSGAHEPWVLWHTGAALRERLVGLAAGAFRTGHLENALGHLAAAMERLPVQGAEMLHAEVLHDSGQIYLALDDPPAAVTSLQKAWHLLVDQQATDRYLASMTRCAQAQAALAMAHAQPMTSTRHDWAQRAAAYLEEVQALGLMEPEEWQPEARRLARFLEEHGLPEDPLAALHRFTESSTH